MDNPEDIHTNIEKEIEDLEKVFSTFKEEIQALKFEQDKVVQEYIDMLAKKKKETLFQNSTQ
jgi:hypothetical protein